MILRTRNADSEDKKLLYSSGSSVYTKQHFTIGFRVEHESQPQESLSMVKPFASLGGTCSKLSSSGRIFFALDLRCPACYSARGKTKSKLLCSSTWWYAIRACVRRIITHLSVIFNCHFLGLNFWNDLHFQLSTATADIYLTTIQLPYSRLKLPK